MKLKKLASLAIAAVSALSLAACSSSNPAVTSGASSEKTTLKLGVVGAVYEDLWQPAKELLAGEGIDLQIVQFGDYSTPNNALASGDIDLNAFQHVAFLESDSKANGYKIAAAGYTFIIPLNLYSAGAITSVDQIKDGDKIAYPNDPTNGGRALKVLEAAGVLTLKDGAGLSPTADDIASFAKKIQLVPLAANLIQSNLPDVTAGFVNGNYALSAGLDPATAVYQDKKLDEKAYWNVIAARNDDLNNPEKKALYEKVVKAFQSEQTKKLFETTFKGYFVAQGWDENLLK
ncbi:MAG: MetQ/NlpA family ABC transporter substrate-binding protein [Actinomycetaceae bacterium]|nr:MetQ/NlpA family ABC transporter substrate-binding protein [Arcanobacterium sp.]MDD7687329.1 MetQ/NlpA family ABC transporter substrate-binding protein [Actinomycetaceae bacterium]MDY5274098.1 MetQ/NlpA family ABC transporter substrate-binding protein [Arcanobacterium sp.]